MIISFLFPFNCSQVLAVWTYATFSVREASIAPKVGKMKTLETFSVYWWNNWCASLVVLIKTTNGALVTHHSERNWKLEPNNKFFSYLTLHAPATHGTDWRVFFCFKNKFANTLKISIVSIIQKSQVFDQDFQNSTSPTIYAA